MTMRILIPLGALALALASSGPALAQQQRTDSVHFEAGSSKMTEIAQAILDEVAIAAKARAYTSVWVDSNSDAKPPAAALKLSRAMGKAVADYLAAQGIDKKRIRVTALGSARPVVVAPQGTMDRVRNRYVNITINWTDTD